MNPDWESSFRMEVRLSFVKKGPCARTFSFWFTFWFTFWFSIPPAPQPFRLICALLFEWFWGTKNSIENMFIVIHKVFSIYFELILRSKHSNRSESSRGDWPMSFWFWFSFPLSFSFPCLPSEGVPQNELAMRGGRNNVRVSSDDCRLSCAIQSSPVCSLNRLNPPYFDSAQHRSPARDKEVRHFHYNTESEPWACRKAIPCSFFCGKERTKESPYGQSPA